MNFFILSTEGVFPAPDNLSQAELDSLGDALYYTTDKQGLPDKILLASATAEKTITSFMGMWADHPMIETDLMAQLLAL